LAEWNAYNLWTDMYPKAAKDPSALINAIYSIFGLEGLFNMMDNNNVHPLAQLVAIGKSLVDSAIRNLGYYAGSTFVSLVTLGTSVSTITGMLGSFLYQIAMVSLGVGFILFYLIPFLPFIYFFFAVGGWVKGIFEAMVGVPLWALAHIRIDGHGLPGDSALGGYYLILEVFLRPILIVFGMVASIIILTAQVYVLHQIWPLVTSNLTGFEDATSAAAQPNTTGNVAFKRGPVDQFFFTVVYAIVVYMQAMASFKLIDLIPDHILRWTGQGVKSFGEQNPDIAENLVRNISVGEHYVQKALGPVDAAVTGTRDGLAKSIASGKSA
ncbi:MAG TPA: DotA/TraY family protein, partial [Alphaproteobacteria bacterium]